VLLAVEFVESVPENILSRPEVKRKQYGGDRYYADIRA
jgi:hypothetical protein